MLGEAPGAGKSPRGARPCRHAGAPHHTKGGDWTAARLCVKIKPEDNVAIAIRDLEPGTEVLDGVVTVEKVPQAHKIALTDIPKGADVVHFGVVLAHALENIAKGRWINEHMIDLPVASPLDQMEYGTNIVPVEDLPDPTVTTWDGYRNPNGGFGGTRNILAIQTAGQCVEGVVNVALDRIKHELLPKYPHVDDVGANNGAYGCSMAINAHEVYIPQRILRNLVHHPHFGGRVTCAGLGCEKFTTDMLLAPEDNTPETVVILQEEKGFEAMISAIMEMAEKKLQILHQRRAVDEPRGLRVHEEAPQGDHRPRPTPASPTSSTPATTRSRPSAPTTSTSTCCIGVAACRFARPCAAWRSSKRRARSARGASRTSAPTTWRSSGASRRGGTAR